MATLNDRVLDNGLTTLSTEADEIYITSQEATTYTEAITTFALGKATTISIGNPSDLAGGGRKVVMSSVSDGSVSNTGTATHYAIVDTANTRLLATAGLTTSQAVTAGNTFTLSSLDVGIPDPA